MDALTTLRKNALPEPCPAPRLADQRLGFQVDRLGFPDQCPSEFVGARFAKDLGQIR